MSRVTDATLVSPSGYDGACATCLKKRTVHIAATHTMIAGPGGDRLGVVIA